MADLQVYVEVLMLELLKGLDILAITLPRPTRYRLFEHPSALLQHGTIHPASKRQNSR